MQDSPRRWGERSHPRWRPRARFPASDCCDRSRRETPRSRPPTTPSASADLRDSPYSAAKVRAQLQIQLQLSSRTAGGGQGKALQDVESIGVLQVVDETNDAGIISVHDRQDIHLGNPSFIGFVLMETQISGLQSCAARERPEIRDNRRISGGDGPEILAEEGVTLLLDVRQGGANGLGTSDVGSHEGMLTLDGIQFRLR